MCKRPLEPTRDARFLFQGQDHDEACHRVKFAPDAMERAFAATQGIPHGLNRMAKLALEFAGRPEYPKVKVTAVNAVVRDMKRHQTLAIA